LLTTTLGEIAAAKALSDIANRAAQHNVTAAVASRRLQAMCASQGSVLNESRRQS
jgi:hypothetical protein